MVRNRSFTVPQSVVSMYQLEEYARPMVGRSVQVNSLCFTKRDWKANVASEAKAHLLVFTPDAKENGNEGVKSYLESGEAADIDKGYKTSIRDQWWVIPSIKLSDALFLRRNNLYLSIGKEEMSVKNMMEAVGLKNRPNFLDYSLTPAINEGFVCMKYPDNPHHPRQKYLLTVKGLMLLDENNCETSKI